MKTHRTIRNCDDVFAFRCPNEWAELKETDSETVRFCGTCEANVYFCSTDRETIDHAKQGHCIARAIPDDSERDKPSFARRGRPASGETFAEPKEGEGEKLYQRELSVTRALQNLELGHRDCPGCGFPVVRGSTHCSVCKSEA